MSANKEDNFIKEVKTLLSNIISVEELDSKLHKVWELVMTHSHEDDYTIEQQLEAQYFYLQAAFFLIFNAGMSFSYKKTLYSELTTLTSIDKQTEH